MNVCGGLSPEACHYLGNRKKIVDPDSQLFKEPPLAHFQKPWAAEWNSGSNITDWMQNPSAASFIFRKCDGIPFEKNRVIAHGAYLNDSGVQEHVCVACCKEEGYPQINDLDCHFGYRLQHDQESGDIVVQSNIQHAVNTGPADAANIRLCPTHIPGVHVALSTLPEYETWYVLAVFVDGGMWNCQAHAVIANPQDWSTKIISFGFKTVQWRSKLLFAEHDLAISPKVEPFLRGMLRHAGDSKENICRGARLAFRTSCACDNSTITGWNARLAALHAKQPLLSLKDALLPTFPLLRRKLQDQYKDYTDDDFFTIIDEVIARMRILLSQLGLIDTYEVEMAAAINIFTKESPAWYWIMSEAFNDVKMRGQSPDVSACLPYSKFLLNALEHLPSEFLEKGSSVRGVTWVFPSPLHHDPEKHFPIGTVMENNAWKSATTDTSMVQQQEQFCGRQGIRTIFKYEAGGIAYKISAFSDFPDESEVLLPILARFRVKAVVKLIKVKLHGGETDATVRTDEFKNSSDHEGDPDIIVLEPV